MKILTLTESELRSFLAPPPMRANEHHKYAPLPVLDPGLQFEHSKIQGNYPAYANRPNPMPEGIKGDSENYDDLEIGWIADYPAYQSYAPPWRDGNEAGQWDEHIPTVPVGQELFGFARFSRIIDANADSDTLRAISAHDAGSAESQPVFNTPRTGVPVYEQPRSTATDQTCITSGITDNEARAFADCAAGAGHCQTSSKC